MLGNITEFFVVSRANTHHNVTAFEVDENGFNNKLNMSRTDHNFSIISKKLLKELRNDNRKLILRPPQK